MSKEEEDASKQDKGNPIPQSRPRQVKVNYKFCERRFCQTQLRDLMVRRSKAKKTNLINRIRDLRKKRQQSKLQQKSLERQQTTLPQPEKD